MKAFSGTWINIVAFVRKFLENSGHYILELYSALVQVRFSQSKAKLYIYYHKLGIRVASRVANHKSQEMLRNYETLKKSQIWLETKVHIKVL